MSKCSLAALVLFALFGLTYAQPLNVFAAYATAIEEPWDGVIHTALLNEEAAGRITYAFVDDIVSGLYRVPILEETP